MMSNLKGIIPGAQNWPHFERNLSEQYEARLTMVEMQKSPSILFAGMEGSRIPWRPRTAKAAPCSRPAAMRRLPLAHGARFVDNPGAATEQYPLNPNGSPQGHHRRHDARRPLDDHDAAPGAGVPQRPA